MKDVFITGGLRTFISAINKAYRNIPAEQLASPIIKNLHINNPSTELVIAGNATCGGGNIARLSLLYAGLADTISGITVDAQCASGMESIISAYSRIKAGLNSTIIAGGTESASTHCIRHYNPSHPNFIQDGNNVYNSAQFIPEDYSDNAMIAGADKCCLDFKICQENMIPSIIKSHSDAHNASENVFMKKIVLPCFGAVKDDLIRPSISKEFIQKLKPVLKNGIITPASSCLFSDGAAFITLSDEKKDFFGNGSVFKITDAVSAGSDRFLSPLAMTQAIDRLLSRNNLSPSQIDRMDYNQAFACLDVLFSRKYSNHSNEFGGALAYGHPYGASGAVILLHLICAMETFDEKLGIAAIPAAGGIGSAILIERTPGNTE